MRLNGFCNIQWNIGGVLKINCNYNLKTIRLIFHRVQETLTSSLNGKSLNRSKKRQMNEATKRAFENRMLNTKRLAAVESFLWVCNSNIDRIILKIS